MNTDRILYEFSDHSKWIWAEDNYKKNDFVAFRKVFTLCELPTQATMTIAVDTKYWLYINDHLVVFEGGLFRESMPHCGYADQIELASYLKNGENIICILSRYFGNGGRNNVDSGTAGLRFECPQLKLYSDEHCITLRHTAYYTPTHDRPSYLYGGDHIGYDANKPIGNFTTLNYDASNWKNAVVYDNKTFGKTYLRPIPNLYYGNAYIDCAILHTIEQNEHIYTIKLPYAMAFTPIIQLIANGGEQLWLTSDHEWVNGGPGDEHSCYHSQCIEYICHAGQNHFDCLHYLYGEQFIVKSKEELQIQTMGYHETGYDTKICGTFDCDNPILNRLIEKAARTLYVCMRDNFMDCPDRERGQWIGDVSVQVPQVFYLLTESSQKLVKKAIYDFLFLRNGDVLWGNVPGAHCSELPAQSLNAISAHGMIAQYYYFTHDTEVLQATFAPSIAYLKLWNLSEDGKVLPKGGNWNWFDHLYNIDIPVLENAWYLSALKFAKKIADIIDDHSEDTFIQERIQAIETSFETFWNGECYTSGTVIDDRANAMAVLCGACPKERYPLIRNALLKVFSATTYMENYVLTALCEMGYLTDAYNRMCARYYLLAQNENSTLWEDFYILGTKNHGWSGAPVNIAFRYFLGLHSTDGFKTFTINPAKELFEYINCEFPIGDKIHSIYYNHTTNELKQTIRDISN